jgi:hypothetical protein
MHTHWPVGVEYLLTSLAIPPAIYSSFDSRHRLDIVNWIEGIYNAKRLLNAEW